MTLEKVGTVFIYFRLINCPRPKRLRVIFETKHNNKVILLINNHNNQHPGTPKSSLGRVKSSENVKVRTPFLGGSHIRGQTVPTGPAPPRIKNSALFKLSIMSPRQKGQKTIQSLT